MSGMRPVVIMLAGAFSGALIAIAAVLLMAQAGLMPINDGQMQTYLMTHPELAPAMMGRAQQLDDQKQAAAQDAAMKKVGQAAFFDPAVAFVTGPADAKTSLVEFYDYDCPYCRASLPAVKKFYDAHKSDTRFSFIEFPIADLHGQSALLAARASLAARRQPEHYMDFHFTLLGEEGQVTEEMIYADAAKAGMDVGKLKADMTDPAIAKTLTSSIALAHKVGVDGTPTFVLNGKFHPGMVDVDTLVSEMKS
jgi:protein-disulfide isomerase